MNKCYSFENLSQRLNVTTQIQREKDISKIKALNSALGQLKDERQKLETDKNR